MHYRCLIVDDEPIAGEIIASFLERLEGFELLGICQSPVQAFERLQREPVDLLFLDIHMPRLNGLELLRSLSKRPAVVLTTAHRDYAPESYELDVLDYLLKPIAFDRFLQAIGKFYARQEAAPPSSTSQGKANPSSSPAPSFPESLFVRSERQMVRVRLDDILYLESLKDYLRIVTPSDRIVTKETLQTMEERLPPDRFIRVHRGFIIQKIHITAFNAHEVIVGGREIPIGRSYKLGFEQAMGR